MIAISKYALLARDPEYSGDNSGEKVTFSNPTNQSKPILTEPDTVRRPVTQEDYSILEDPETLLRELGIVRNQSGHTVIGRSRLLPKQELIQLYPASITREIELERSMQKEMSKYKTKLKYFRRVTSAKGGRAVGTNKPERKQQPEETDEISEPKAVKATSSVHKKGGLKQTMKGQTGRKPAVKVKFKEEEFEVVNNNISEEEIEDLGDSSVSEGVLSEENEEIGKVKKAKTIQEIASDFEDEFKGEKSVLKEPEELLKTLTSLRGVTSGKTTSKSSVGGGGFRLQESSVTDSLPSAVSKISKSNSLKLKPLQPMVPLSKQQLVSKPVEVRGGKEAAKPTVSWTKGSSASKGSSQLQSTATGGRSGQVPSTSELADRVRSFKETLVRIKHSGQR